MSRRKRKTDHEKTIEFLRAVAPTLQEGFRTLGSWVAIPSVGISLLWFLMIVQRNLIIKKDGTPKFDTGATGPFGIGGSLESTLALAVAAAAVVPAAEAASKFIGPAISGLLAGGSGGGPPIG